VCHSDTGSDSDSDSCLPYMQPHFTSLFPDCIMSLIDEEAEERQAALDAEKAQKEQLRLQEVSRILDPRAV
jgi:hypothetical protein